MNPFRENDTPPVNKTEIELARIRETEETKRKIGVEREKTKQSIRSNDGYWWIRAVALASTVLVALMSYLAYSKHVEAEHPSMDRGCTESVEVISINDSRKECLNGGWYEVTPRDDHAIIRCRCGAKPSAASAAPSSSVQ